MTTTRMTAQQRRDRQARLFLFALLGVFVLYMAANYFAGRIFLANEREDLSQSGWLLVPAAQTDVELASIQARLITGECQPQNVECGKWLPAHKLDFTKIVDRGTRTVFLVAQAELAKHVEAAKGATELSDVEKRMLGLSARDAHLAITFNDAYAELTAWINGKKTGATSRHMSPSTKPFAFTNTEAIPIMDRLVQSSGKGSDLIVVRVDRFSDVDLPPVFRLNAFAIFDVGTYVTAEFFTLLTLVGSVVGSMFLGLYHLVIWFRRRDDTGNLAFFLFVTACILQMFFFYNFAGYFGVSPSTTWMWRMVFVHNIPLPFLIIAFFAGMPLSYTYEHIREKRRGNRNTVFASVGWVRKFFIIVGDFIVFIAFPLVALFSVFAPLHISSIIVYKFSVPMNIVLAFGLTISLARWFYFTAKKQNLMFAFPMAIAIALFNGGVFSGMAGALGARGWSGLAVGYATTMFTFLFAIALSNQFNTVYRRLGKLKGRLDIILQGTKELAKSREVLDVARQAVGHIVAQINIDQATNVDLYLLQEGSKSAPTICKRMRIMENGVPVESPLSETVAADVYAGFEGFFASGLTKLNAKGDVLIPLASGAKRIGFLQMDKYLSDEMAFDDAHFMNTLAPSMAIACENIRFVKETADKAKLEAEVEAASAVQEALLPREWKIPFMEVATVYQSASQTGGDWFGYHLHENKRFVDFYVGDVTGHGIAAALLTGVVSGSIYSSERLFDKLGGELVYDPVRRINLIAEIVNSMVVDTGRSNLFMTMTFLSLDLLTGEATYLNAGHNAVFLRRAEKTVPQVVLNPGNRLGHTEEPTFAIRKIKLKPGDSFVMYTDGLIENVGPDRALFKESRLRELIGEHENPQELRDAVMKEARAIWQDVPADDDVTLLAVRWKEALVPESKPEHP